MFSRPKILFLFPYFCSTIESKFNPYLPFKFLIFYHSIQIVHGRPRHPQTQGVIERAHRTLEQKLATQFDTSTAWSDLLPVLFVSGSI